MASDISAAAGPAVASNGESPTLKNPVGLPDSAFEADAVEKQPLLTSSQMKIASDVERETGDQVNRFLLCTLVSESSKTIKAIAERAGHSLPMSMIVRGVLRSYRAAAKDKYGPLAGVELDIAGLRELNEQVLKDEVARQARDSVKNSQRHLADAERHGDDTRIKAGKDALERAIASRDRAITAP